MFFAPLVVHPCGETRVQDRHSCGASSFGSISVDLGVCRFFISSALVSMFSTGRKYEMFREAA